MSKQTPLYQDHLKSGGKMVDFSGWEMPLHYGSQMEEHHIVRDHAGLFDVSHMGVVDLNGSDAKAWLQQLLANDVARLKQPGRALYSCMLNKQGGVIDDLIVYFIGDNSYRIVINAGTRDKDLNWMRSQSDGFSITLTERTELAMIAVQGPQAREILHKQQPNLDTEASALKRFYGAQIGDLFVGRTGYTGEDGYEIILPAEQASAIWQSLLAGGAKPCGLGARDTLRLEAGMNLYGQDMDENTTPLVSGLSWTVAMKPEERDFNGRSSLTAQLASGVPQRLVGLLLEDRGVLRHGQRVVTDVGDGTITSGTFSPSLKKSIALARIPAGDQLTCSVEIRGKLLSARIVRPPFVRDGKVLVE